MSLLYLASQILKYLPLWQHKKRTREVPNESKLRRWRWKHGTQVGHNVLMLMHHAILNAINSLLEVLKLRSEPSLILVHPILHRIKSCVIDHCKLHHASTKKANQSKYIHPRSMVRSIRYLRLWCLSIGGLSECWSRE